MATSSLTENFYVTKENERAYEAAMDSEKKFCIKEEVNEMSEHDIDHFIERWKTA